MPFNAPKTSGQLIRPYSYAEQDRQVYELKITTHTSPATLAYLQEIAVGDIAKISLTASEIAVKQLCGGLAYAEQRQAITQILSSVVAASKTQPNVKKAAQRALARGEDDRYDAIQDLPRVANFLSNHKSTLPVAGLASPALPAATAMAISRGDPPQPTKHTFGVKAEGSHAYDVGRPPKLGLYKENARFNNLAHLCSTHSGEEKNDLSRSERKLAKVWPTASGPRFRDVGGRFHALAPGRYIYTVSPKGNLYIKPQAPELYHSNILSGRAVQCAGLLHVDQGKSIDYVDNSSGHYRPSRAQLLHTMHGLEKFLAPECRIRQWHDGNETPEVSVEELGNYQWDNPEPFLLTDTPTSLGQSAERRRRNAG